VALTVIGIAIVAVIGFWILGGLFLRAAGVVCVFAGAVSLIALRDPTALFILALGFVMWLAGHWHFALRHHEYKSPLAQRIFLQALPPRYDPTRRWAVPVASEEPPLASSEEHPSEPPSESDFNAR
jgi:hypothetical protein